MHYQEFETQFEALLQKKRSQYPFAADYLRSRFLQTISYLLTSILTQTENYIKQGDAIWTNMDEVVSDILHCAEISIDQLFDIEVPTQLPKNRDFEMVKERLYETPYYPISEHLNYISWRGFLYCKFSRVFGTASKLHNLLFASYGCNS